MTRRSSHPVLKVCGATTDGDVDQVAAGGAHLVGLWHGVPGGPAELPRAGAARLADRALGLGLEPVLVTFLDDADMIADVVASTGVRWVQLHAYQPPALVRAVKDRHPDLTVIKVLHVERDRCLEARFVGAYERAGADLLLLDSVDDDGRVGSTGSVLPLAVALEVVERTTHPFLLAGGVTAAGRGHHARLAGRPHFRGVDVDTAARDEAGRLCAERVRAIGRAWSTTVEALA
jgi:phosphoribosylanthranilate isomerase